MCNLRMFWKRSHSVQVSDSAFIFSSTTLIMKLSDLVCWDAVVVFCWNWNSVANLYNASFVYNQTYLVCTFCMNSRFLAYSFFNRALNVSNMWPQIIGWWVNNKLKTIQNEVVVQPNLWYCPSICSQGLGWSMNDICGVYKMRFELRASQIWSRADAVFTVPFCN